MDKIILQYINIYMGIGVMALVGSRFRKMQYGFDVILIKYLFQNDVKPIRWLRYHLIFLYYLGFEFYMFMRTMGLIQQVRDGTLNFKPDVFFASGPLGLVFIALMLQYYFSKEDRYYKVFNYWFNKSNK